MGTASNNSTVLRPSDGDRILRLRLAIARAGQSDSMGWWVDESLTPDATFLLGRLFPRSIERSRQRLALQSAFARHRAELVAVPDARHLFDLGDEVEFEIAQLFQRNPLAHYPPTPITSIDELRSMLIEILGTSHGPSIDGVRNGRILEIDVGARTAPAQAAELLAWSYLRSASDGAIFPCFRGK